MEQYISKSAVVAKIKKLKGQLLRGACSSQISMETRCKEEAYNEVLSFLNTLEVKEVDLEKEIETHLKDCLDVKFPTTDIELIKKDVAYTAKKFFELGMSVSKQAEKDLQLTWEDIRELYIVFAEVDTEIELCKTDIKTETLGYYQEVLKRFKAQKGE